MAKATVYNVYGKAVGISELPEELFSISPDFALIHEAVRAIQAGSRMPIAHTKTRGEVRGGGRKPWKQKGTGRARHGSIRSPLWRGGGVIFGPRNERNFFLKMNRKAKRKAFAMCLSDKASSEHLILLEGLPEEKKAKVFSKLFSLLPLKDKKLLVALANEEKEFGRAMRNIPRTGVIGVGSLNIVDLLSYPHLAMTKKGMEELQKIYIKKI